MAGEEEDVAVRPIVVLAVAALARAQARYVFAEPAEL